MSRNRFEVKEDPAEDELPLEEVEMRGWTTREVDETITLMSPEERRAALHTQFHDTSRIDENIASLKQHGLWATARFYERLREQAT